MLQTSPQQSNKAPANRNSKCSLCNQTHYLNKCEQFIRKSIPERRDFVQLKNLCSNCLGHHHIRNCNSCFRCLTCKHKHNTLLHNESASSGQFSNALSSDQSENVTTPSNPNQNCSIITVTSASQIASPTTNTSRKSTGVLLATARVNDVSHNGTKLLIRALIDPCSQVSLVTQALCNQLSLNLKATHVCIQGVGEKTAAIASKVARLSIQPYFESSFSMDIEALVLPKLSSYKPPPIQSPYLFEHLTGLQLADPCYSDQSRIDMLLGASDYATIIEDRIIKGQSLQPIALSSKLGWLLTGNIAEQSKNQYTEPLVLHCNCDGERESQLLELV